MTSRQVLYLKVFIAVMVVGIAGFAIALARYAMTGASGTPRTELERAVVAAEQAVRANPQDHASRVKLAAAYLERGDVSAAIEQATTSVRLDPKDPSGYYVLGLAETKRRDAPSAIKHLQKAVGTKGQLAQFYQDAHMALARAYEQNGQGKDAIAAMSRALDSGPENVIILYERGKLYERQQNWKSAMEDYAVALEYVPNYDPARTAFEALKKTHPDVFQQLQRYYNETTTGAVPSGKK